MNLHRPFLILGVLLLAVAGCSNKEQNPRPEGSVTSMPQPTANHSGSGPPPPPAPALVLSGISPNTDLELSTKNEVVIKGQGFDPSVKVYAGDEEIIPTDIKADEIRFGFHNPTQVPSDFIGPWDHWGITGIKVKSADGREAALQGGFYFFDHPSWTDLLPFPGSHILDIAVLNDKPYLATETGIDSFDATQWHPMPAGHEESIFFCSPFPSANNGFSLLCAQPLLLKSFAPHNDLVALIESKYCLSCGKELPNRLIVSHGGAAWTEIKSLPGEPYAVKTTATAIYALTTQGVYSSMDGLQWSVLLSAPLSFDFSNSSVPLETWPFEVHESASQIQLFIGTPNGINFFTYNQVTHTISSVLRIGPAISPPISALAVDETTGRLYFAYAPSNAATSLKDGGLGSMEIASIASSPVDNGVSLAPWTPLSNYGAIQKIIPAPPALFVIAGHQDTQGWNPEVDRVENSTLLNFIPQLMSGGFTPLTAGSLEEIPFLGFEGGKTYLLLKDRNCLLQMEGLECLGEDPELGHQYVQFLLQNDSDHLSASTATTSYVFAPDSSAWHKQGAPASFNERTDLDFASLGDMSGINGWPLSCALAIPEKDLTFACAPEGVYVRYQKGRWNLIRDTSHIHSLAYQSSSKTLYGASSYRGVLKMAIP